MMLDDPSLGGAGPGLLNTSMKSEGGLSGKGDYGEEEVGAERNFDPSEAAESTGEGQLALDSDSVKIMAETVSVGGLPEEAAREIADEVSYRVKMLVQNAAKLMHHGKRAKLTCDDVDQALRMTGQEPIYGFQAGEHIPFRFTSGGGRDLHFMEDKELGNDYQTNHHFDQTCSNLQIYPSWCPALCLRSRWQQVYGPTGSPLTGSSPQSPRTPRP